MTRRLRLGLAATLASALSITLLATGSQAAEPAPGDNEVAITVDIPAPAAVSLANAELTWTLNNETGSGAFFGGCNFLMAGVPGRDGNAGSSHVWKEASGFYRATDGNVSIEKPTAKGTYVGATFANKCQDPQGNNVTVSQNNFTASRVVMTGGSGTLDPKTGETVIRWKGTFSVVYYGGMTYWWVSDPTVRVLANGQATLSGTAGGYGTSMEDTSKWTRLTPTPITLATTPAVTQRNDRGFVVTPDYLGRRITAPAASAPQVACTTVNRDYCGAFPQDFVTFQGSTGQAAYWYSSGGVRDQAQVATPVRISYDAAAPITEDIPTTPSKPGTPVTQPQPGAGNPQAGNTNAGRGAAANSGTGAAKAAASAQSGNSEAYPATPANTVGKETNWLPEFLAATGPAERLLYLVTALLLLGTATVIGFKKKWLVLPGRK